MQMVSFRHSMRFQIINTLNTDSGTSDPGPVGPPPAPTTRSIATLVPFAETRVNTTSRFLQESPAVAVTPNGYVAVWVSDVQDGSGLGIVGQRHDAAGNKVGTEFIVLRTRYSQRAPQIDAFDDGRFVVAWESDNQDGSGIGVYARIFDASGIGLTGDLQVNQSTDGTQRMPDVAVLSNGNFVVSWEGKGTVVPWRNDSYGVHMRVFTGQGVGLTDEYRVNDQGSGLQEIAVVAAQTDGGFAIAWYGDGRDDSTGINLRQFNALGLPIGSEIAVNSFRHGDQRQPAIDVASDGRIVVVWASTSEDGSGWSVHSQQYSSGGVPLGGPQRVNQKTTGTQWRPDVAYVADGGYVVAWEGYGFGDVSGVHMRRFDRFSQVLAGQVIVSTTTKGRQVNIALDSSANGFVAAWNGRGPGDYEGVFSRSFVVATPNAPPTLNPVPDQAVNELQRFELTATAHDAEGDPLTFSLDQASHDRGMAIDGTTGAMSWTPTEAQGPGEYPVTVIVSQSDTPGSTTSQSFAITVREVNTAPVIAPINDATIEENATFQVQASATDVDLPVNALTYSLVASPTGASINADTGLIQWTPDAPDGRGQFDFRVRVTDNGSPSLFAVESFVVTVTGANRPPTFTKGSDVALLEDSGAASLPGWATNISAGSVAETDQTVTFIVTSDKPELFAVAPAIAPNGTLTFRPAPNAFGNSVVTVVLMDDGGTADGGQDTSPALTFNLAVTPVNDAPGFTKGADVSATAISGPVTRTGWATNISPGNSFEADQTLTFLITSDNPELFADGPSISPNGTLTFTPATDASGTATVTVVLMDGGGTANGGQDKSPAQAFSVDIISVNTAPSFAKGDDVTVNEDSGATTLASWATDISAGASHETGQTLSFAVNTDNPDLFAVAPVVTPSGTLSFTPADNAFGTASVTVLLTDDGGTANGGQDQSPPQTFSILILPVNDPPSFVKGADHTVSADGQAVTVPSWATEISPGPANESDQLESFVVTNDHPEYFDVGPSVDSQGVLRFTPKTTAAGNTIVTVRAKDNGGTANGGDDTSQAQTFVISLAQCPFDTQLSGWTVREGGGSATGHGTVKAENCEALLIEGDSFVVSLQTTFVLTDEQSEISITFAGLDFDDGDTEFINDAFEVALVDELGNSLVGAFQPGRDASFNLTEGLAAATSSQVSLVNALEQDGTIRGGTIVFDTSALLVGQQATLIARLVNNDADTQTSVRIVDYSISSTRLPQEEPFNPADGRCHRRRFRRVTCCSIRLELLPSRSFTWTEVATIGFKRRRSTTRQRCQSRETLCWIHIEGLSRFFRLEMLSA